MFFAGLILAGIGLALLGIQQAMISLHRRGKVFARNPMKMPIFDVLFWASAIFIVVGSIVIYLAPSE